MTEAEVGGRVYKSRTLEDPLTTTRSWKRQEGPSPDSGEGAQPSRHLHVGLPASKAVRDPIPVCTGSFVTATLKRVMHEGP